MAETSKSLHYIHARSLDRPYTTDSSESGANLPYRNLALTGAELGRQPIIIEQIRSMLLAQPAERFHRRYPEFKYHEEPTTARRGQYEAAKGAFVDNELAYLTGSPDAKAVVVYDTEGNLAVFADAYPMNKIADIYEVGIIRNSASRSLLGKENLTQFTLQRIFQVCLQEESVRQVVARVHRNNPKSRGALYKLLENLEANGYQVGWTDGRPVEDPRSNSKTGKHWRSYAAGFVNQ